MKFQSLNLGNNGLLKSVTSFTVNQITSALNGQSKDCTRCLGSNLSIGTFFLWLRFTMRIQGVLFKAWKKICCRVSFVRTHNFKWSQSPSLFM